MANIITAPKTNKTGYKLGSLSAVIWWLKENEPVYVHGCRIDGHILMPPTEIGDGGALARQLWEARPDGRPSYKDRGYQWKEAGTLKDVQILQRRWEDQEMKVLRHMGHHDAEVRKKVHAQTASNMRQRMQSKDCTPFEREFIDIWLRMRDDKQDEYTKKWEDKIFYNQALEMDSNNHFEDRMGG